MVIAAQTGRCSSATLTAEAPEAPLSTTFVVTYAEEPTLKMLVPTTATSAHPRQAQRGSLREQGHLLAFRLRSR